MANQFAGEIIHFHSIRYTITGSGVLDSELNSSDDVTSQTLPTITMAAATNRQPTILCNYKEQTAYLEFSVDAINEWFHISKINIFIKPIATGYPQ